jgi:hypothetical protein
MFNGDIIHNYSQMLPCISVEHIKCFSLFWLFSILFRIFVPTTKTMQIMTATAQRIKETPMAPYISLLRGMTREQKRIVMTFITESMEEPVPKRQVPAEFKKLRGMVNITEEEMAQDGHLAHIMER